MAAQRMTLPILAQRVATLAQRVTTLGQRVDTLGQRVEGLSDRFDGFRADIDARLEQFAERIELSFKVSLEGMERKLDAALDRTKEQKRRLDAFEPQNQREHRLMQTQITELDAQLQSRRRRGRPS